ncbi:hypothetical protein HJC23_004279 [Cyclotella cryptica]|uniref:Metallo-beta-lactamase domain-containing protein n=1 Tax=Cyclotella cryptica TaxID=29204 RepID=A0ABD3Q4C8_9STRA
MNCINCGACSNFAPSSFQRNDSIKKHVVYHQPSLSRKDELESARAALAACPVAAIRVESAPDGTIGRDYQRELSIGSKHPFPRPIYSVHSTDEEVDLGVYYLGHHNDASFGATPYLVLGKSPQGKTISVMVDVPRFGPSAVRAIKSLAPNGPDYLFLTHVDDTADHNKWVGEFTSLKRIFHSGDLGRHNWIGDKTLENVEILLKGASGGEKLMFWDIDGNPLSSGWLGVDIGEEQFVILHTPGHSPGSISLLFRPRSSQSEQQPPCQETVKGILFTGDTYAWTTRDGGHMSGFPRYGNDLSLQAETLQKIGQLVEKWDIIAPGHGHPRFYGEGSSKRKLDELSVAVNELNS